jgi:uncharacterized protein YlxW (UPF0749 family)
MNMKKKRVMMTMTKNRKGHVGSRVAKAALVLALFTPIGCQGKGGTTAGSTPNVDELRTRITNLEQQLGERQADIDKLQHENEALGKKVPQPHRVGKGENHWQIAFDFLTHEEGLSADEAKKKLAGAFLLDPVVEGFDTWNFYDGQHFGSFVTQEDAPISPGELLKRKEARTEGLREQIASLQREKQTVEGQLAKTVVTLRTEREAKRDEVAALRSDIDALEQRQEWLASHVGDLRQRLSSVYYLAGSKANLRNEGKIERALLDVGGPRLGAGLHSEDFQNRLDLRETSEIELRADKFNLSRIGNVEVLPSNWKKGRDYNVKIAADGSSATVELLSPDQFRMKTLVLVVDS